QRGEALADRAFIVVRAPGALPLPWVIAVDALNAGATPVTISAYSNRVVRGDEASLTVQTDTLGVTCSIRYRGADGVTVEGGDLGPHTTGAEGATSWAWEIDADAMPGLGTVSVTCGGDPVSKLIHVE